MTKKYTSECALGPRALEMVMRDVLGGMEELASMKGYEHMSGVYEIISIDPPSDQTHERMDTEQKSEAPERADVLSMEEFRNRKERP
jgi:hypothetical protein